MRAAGAWATPLSKGWRLLEPQPPRLEVHTDGTCGVTINVLLSDPAAFIAGGTYVEGASAVGGGGGGGGGDGAVAGSAAAEGLVVRPGCGHGTVP